MQDGFSSTHILNRYEDLQDIDWTLDPDAPIYEPDITPEEKEDECIERNCNLDETFNCGEGAESSEEMDNWYPDSRIV